MPSRRNSAGGLLAAPEAIFRTRERRVKVMPIADDVHPAEEAAIVHRDLANLYGYTVVEKTKIGPFVEIQKNVVIGKACKIGSPTFICEGVSIDDDCFIGHHVCFIKDRYPGDLIYVDDRHL